MSRFVEGEDRRQPALPPSCLDDYVSEESPVRVIDVFVDELDLAALGFERVQAASTGRPGYHPGAMLKLYLYGYLNQVQSSPRLEREAGRNTELMWLLGKLAPDFETIFGTLKAWMGATHFKTRRLKNVVSEISLLVLAYNLKRAVAILGVQPLIAAMRA